MESRNIVIVPKLSKYAWDMHRLNLTEEEVKGRYEKQGLDARKIIESHERQGEYLERLVGELPQADLVTRDALTKDIANSVDLVIALGGDNHFQYVSKFLGSGLIMGINSDPELSEGALTSSLTMDDLRLVKSNIYSGDLDTEEWTRLRVSVNEEYLDERMISEIFIGEENRMNMSRHLLYREKMVEQQKGSGLLVATGIGSTGWYNSACRWIFRDGDVFEKDAKEAHYVLTEPYRGKLLQYEMTHGVIMDGEEFRVQSLSDSQAVLSLDSAKNIPLNEGDVVGIDFAEPLRVIRFKKDD